MADVPISAVRYIETFNKAFYEAAKTHWFGRKYIYLTPEGFQAMSRFGAAISNLKTGGKVTHVSGSMLDMLYEKLKGKVSRINYKKRSIADKVANEAPLFMKCKAYAEFGKALKIIEDIDLEKLKLPEDPDKIDKSLIQNTLITVVTNRIYPKPTSEKVQNLLQNPALKSFLLKLEDVIGVNKMAKFLLEITPKEIGQLLFYNVSCTIYHQDDPHKIKAISGAKVVEYTVDYSYDTKLSELKAQLEKKFQTPVQILRGDIIEGAYLPIDFSEVEDPEIWQIDNLAIGLNKVAIVFALPQDPKTAEEHAKKLSTHGLGELD